LSYAGGAALANAVRNTRRVLEVDFALATATSLEGSKKKITRSFIYGQSSTSPANFVKIGQVDVEIIGLTEITKIFSLKKQQNKPSSPALHAERVG